MKKKIYIHEFLSRFLKNGVKQSVVLVIRICTNVDKPSPEPSSAWANIDNLMKMFETHGTLSPLEGNPSGLFCSLSPSGLKSRHLLFVGWFLFLNVLIDRLKKKASATWYCRWHVPASSSPQPATSRVYTRYKD